jgi:hypothetical protein
MLNREKEIPEEILQRMRLKGRVKGSEQRGRENNTYFQTFVMVPASDEYSHPLTFGVNASAPLGPDGQDVDVICRVSPFNRKGKDGNLYCNNALWLDNGDDPDTPF